MARLRRILKKSLKLAGLTLGVVILLAGLLLLLLHTNWARELIRERVEKIASSGIPGRIGIGKLEGSLLGRFGLTDLELHDRLGKLLARVDRLTVDFSPWALIDKRIQLEEVRILGPRVFLEQEPDGSWNLARALSGPGEKRLEPEEETGTGAWTWWVDDLAVKQGRVELSGGSPGQVFSGIQLRAALAGGAGWQRLDLWRLDLRWSQDGQERPLELRAFLRRAGEMLVLLDLGLESGGARLLAPWMVLDGSGPGLVGVLDLWAPGDTLRRLTGLQGWRADAALEGTLWKRGDSGSWRFELAGRLDRAPAGLSGKLDARTLTGSARLDIGELELGALLGGTPAAGHRLGKLHARVRLEKKRIHGRLKLATRELEARAEVELSRRPALEIEGGRLEVRVADLSVVPLAQIDLSGTLDLSARLWPDGKGLRADGQLRFGDLKTPWARAAGVELEIQGSGVPEKATTRVSLKARNLQFAGTGMERLAARGQIELCSGCPEIVRGRLTRIAFDWGGREWRGRVGGFHLKRNAGFAVGSLTLESSAGKLELDARRGAALWADARIQGFDLGWLDRRVGIPVVESGIVDARLDLSSQGEMAQLRFQDLRLSGASGAFSSRIDLVREPDGETGLHARITSGTRGRVELSLTGRVPGRLQDLANQAPRRWPGFLEAVALRLEQKDSGSGLLDPLPGWIPGGLRGDLEGTLAVRRRDRGLLFGLRLDGLTSAHYPARADLRLAGRLGQEQAGFGLRARFDDGGRLVARGDLQAGLGRMWTGPGSDWLDVPVAGFARAENVPLEQLSNILGPETAIQGILRARIDLAGRLGDPRLSGSAGAETLRLGDLQLERVRLQGKWNHQAWKLDASARQSGGGSLHVEGHGPAGTPVRLRAEKLEIGDFTGVLGIGPLVRDLGGRLQADLHLLLPSRDKPGRLHGSATVQDGSLRLMHSAGFRDLSLHLDLKGDRAEFELDTVSGEGRLQLDGHLSLLGLSPIRLEARIETDDLPVPGAADRAVLTSSIRLKASREADRWKAGATLKSGAARLLRIGGRELHPAGELEDVVYQSEQEAATEAGGEPAPPAIFELDFDQKQGLAVRGEGFRVEVQSSFQLVAGGQQTSLSGNARISQGWIEIFGNRYRVERAELSFGGQSPPDPGLDVLLARDFPDATLQIQIGGTLSKPEADFRSDPPIYSQAEVLAFVLGGRPGWRESGASSPESAALGIASALVTQTLRDLTQETLPVDVVRVGTDSTGAGQVDNVTVGKWITDRLFVAYQRNFQADESTSANRARLEYWFLPNWLLEGQVGDQGTGELDLLWIRRF